jgi:hypothetical protein
MVVRLRLGQAVTAGQQVTLTIQPPATGAYRAFNVYRSNGRRLRGEVRFIGRVIAAARATPPSPTWATRSPGFVTGLLIEGDTMKMKELAPYSRVKLAQTDLSTPEAHFRFVTLAVTQPRKNAIIDNLVGSF